MKTLSKRRGKILSKPWITKGIRTSIRIKNNLFFNADWEHYKLYRNKITSLTRQSKKNYYERYFEENINNSKETWRGINDIISRKAKSDKKPIHRLVNSNSETIYNPKEISNSRRQIMILVLFQIRQYKVLSTLTLLSLQKSKMKSKCCQITKPMDSIHAQSVF